MLYTEKEYGYFYQQYKKAEAEVVEWITAQSPPNLNGRKHCYSHLGELARKLYQSEKIEMPLHLREKLQNTIELRIKLLVHHRERGDANCEHDFPITMMGRIAQALFPPAEIPTINHLVHSAGIDASLSKAQVKPSSTTGRSRSAPGALPRWQQASSWRSKSADNLRAADALDRGRTTRRPRSV